jgi:3-ketoacyl-CoA synthase
VSHEELQAMMRAQDCFNDGSISFLGRVLERSGTGSSTHWPPALLPSKDGTTKAITSVAAARSEAEEVIFPLVRSLLKKGNIKPRDIDFLIVNCSIFTPTPSLCAMICNEFKLRQDVRSYNLGGMGCSANVISVDLAKQLLQNAPGSRALVISMENLTQNLYRGNDKSMLLQNTLFRAGGAAQLLSSRRVDSLRAKYKLLYTGRTQMSDDNSYSCVFEQEDCDGNCGVALSKDIVKVAGRAMQHNFVQLAPHVLPIREQAKTVLNRLLIMVASRAKALGFSQITAPPAYTPNFAKGIDHFCIHAGGRAVIDGVQKNLNLEERHVKPSKQTLYEWGNTSSSSIWYEADWIERFGNLRRGDRMLQIAFGSGFKCNSAVWLALKVDTSKRGVPLKENGCCQSESLHDFADKAVGA